MSLLKPGSVFLVIDFEIMKNVEGIYGPMFSRMDQLKFVEDSL